MRIEPTSFFLGLAAAAVLPLLARVGRPLTVEAAVAGMALVDQGRRIVAEQMENLEDLVAEARARREEQLAGTNGDVHFEEDTADEAAADATSAPPRPRRRAVGAQRRRGS
jgi:hypothetical protein